MSLPQDITRSDDPKKDWRTINEHLAESSRVNPEISRLSTVVAQLQSRSGDGLTVRHPFQIHSVPSAARSGAEAGVDDWRKFRIRAGRVNHLDVTEGTDGVTFPDEQALPAAADDVTVASNTEKHYFWIEATVEGGIPTAAEVKNGTNPIGEGWDGFPSELWDGTTYRVLIGWVDTATEDPRKLVHVRQLVRGDVFLPVLTGSDARWS